MEIVGDSGLAEPEHPLELSTRDRFAQPPDSPQRQREIDRVYEPCSFSFGLDRVHMHPAGEWPPDHLVGERRALLEVDVPRPYARLERPDGHLERDLRAGVVYRSSGLDHADLLPRRQEPVDGALPGVPVERRGGAVADRMLSPKDHAI